MKLSALYICLPLALFFVITAQADEDEKSPATVRISIEWIEMSASDATGILRVPRTTTNDSDLRDKAEILINAGKAGIYESKVMTTRLGSPSRVESVREEIYPTEYDPPGLAQPDEVKTPKYGATGFVPTAFETRNTGVTFEVDPVYDQESNTFTLQMAAEIVNLVGLNKFATYADEHMKADMTMPLYYTTRINSTTIVRPGECLLAATLTPYDEDGQADRSKKLVVFVRADLLEVGG